MKATPDEHRAVRRLLEDVEAVDWYDMEAHQQMNRRPWLMLVIAVLAASVFVVWAIGMIGAVVDAR